MSKVRRNDRSRKKSSGGTSVATFVIVFLLALSLVGLLGGLGNAIKSFLTGVFGFASYAFLALVALILVAVKLGFSVRRERKRLVAYAVALAVLLLLYAQIVTSHEMYGALSSASYKAYLSACYHGGLKTAGGVVFGVIAFPLLSVMGKFSAIPVSVVFFIVLFFALYPLLKSSASSRPEKSAAPVRRVKEKRRKDEPLSLFVDKVRPGEKDATLFKQKGVFDKKSADFELFNVNDDRPFDLIHGGSVPENRPDRYNPYADRDRGVRSFDRSAEYDYEEEVDPFRPSSGRFSESDREGIGRGYQADSAYSQSFADARIQNEDRSSGLRAKKVFPEEPVFERKVYSAVPIASEKKEQPPKREEKRSRLVHDLNKSVPYVRADDIISDVADLERINRREAPPPKRPPMIGEFPEEPSSISSQPSSESQPCAPTAPKEPKISYKQSVISLEPISQPVAPVAERAFASSEEPKREEPKREEPKIEELKTEESKQEVPIEKVPVVEPAAPTFVSPLRKEFSAAEKTESVFTVEPLKAEEKCEPVSSPAAEKVEPERSAPVFASPVRVSEPSLPDFDDDGFIEDISELESPFSQTSAYSDRGSSLSTITEREASVMKPVEQEYPSRLSAKNQPSYVQSSIEKETSIPIDRKEREPIANNAMETDVSVPMSEKELNKTASLSSLGERPLLRSESFVRSEISESEEEEGRKRKPRSDLGGTHESPRRESSIAPVSQAPVDSTIESPIEAEDAIPPRPYVAPPVDLLTEYPSVHNDDDTKEMGDRLLRALESFGIKSEIAGYKVGPSFTQFAVTLPSNYSINKLLHLSLDIKRKLMIGKKDIRIIPSVPGLDAIGIEIPNQNCETIGLRAMINSPDFEKENKLYFAIGVDVSGTPVYGDLLKMPHLLVAGSTGSGKSVCLNVLICSIIYHYSPEIVRFIMIDPKQVELSAYEGIPHMVLPAPITDVNKAVNALSWAVAEMDRRLSVFKEKHCRNIFDYNDIMKKEGGKRMYYLVIIIDEMAELMSRVKKDVESKIGSLMALARATGIHVVMATQRPSVDVITGTIKNNIPVRISFKVTSVNDSRTIIEKSGAESLFGNGDMLYRTSGSDDLMRLQGPFLEKEIFEIVDFVKEHNDCRFDANAEKDILSEKSVDQDASVLDASADATNGDDPLFADALLQVVETGQASISKLQRVFRLGYSRAARIVDQMEEKGYLGPADSSNKPRAVLITLDEYYRIYGDDGIQGAEGQ